MNNHPPENMGESLQWFTENLPLEYLQYPEYFLYNTVLEFEKLEDAIETRRLFKELLIERQVKEGVELPEINQTEIQAFMQPSENKLRTGRAEKLLEHTSKHLETTGDFIRAQRLALLEIFHKDAPLRLDVLNEKYFNNRELVETDLKAYLEQSTGEALVHLTSSNPAPETFITTQSGEKVRWQTYLKRASGVLFGTDEYKKNNNPHRITEVLDRLKQLCGLNLMNESYFNNINYVKADLTAYLAQGKGNSLVHLNTGNPSPSTTIITQSGESIKWQAYLGHASAILLGTKHNSDTPPLRSDALDRLKEICGVVVINEKYFNNAIYIKMDLETALEAGQGESLADLRTNNPPLNTSIVTQSGESMLWTTYLTHASKILLKTSPSGENRHQTSGALDRLKEICGVIMMNEKYFSNPSIVGADLDIALSKAEGKTLADLSVNNPPMNTPITTQCGKTFHWVNYLKRASRVLFGTLDGGMPHRTSDALDRLKELCGVVMMNEKYFNNPIYIKADLAAFLNHAEGDSLIHLSTGNPPGDATITAQSGETITWVTYLKRASKILKMPRLPDALDRLRELCGVVMMNKKYFNNTTYVRIDLQAYLARGRGNSLIELKTSNPSPDTVIITQSGEAIRWQTYLIRASKSLVDTNNSNDKKNIPPHLSATVKKLIKIASQTDTKTD